MLPCFDSGSDSGLLEQGIKYVTAGFCCSHHERVEEGEGRGNKRKRGQKKCHVCNKEPYLQADFQAPPPPLCEWPAASRLAALIAPPRPVFWGFFSFALKRLRLLEVSAPCFDDVDLPHAEDELKFKASVFPSPPSGLVLDTLINHV